MKLYNLLRQNSDVFSKHPGRFVGLEYHLETYDHKPFREKERMIPYRWKSAVEENIKKLLMEGIIESRSSEYNSALVIIPKKCGEVRMCLDARRLNQVLIPRYDTPARIEEVIKK